MNRSGDNEATYVACLTPAGAGAIACLALRGAEAWSAVRTLFRPCSRIYTELPESLEPGRIWLGRLGQDAADDVVLVVKNDHPVPWVEIQCHGGDTVTQWLQELLKKRGVQVCSWQEFEARAAVDRVQSAVLPALVRAPTGRTAAILLDQYRGAFARAISAVLAAWDTGEMAEVGRLLKQLAGCTDIGRHLIVPWRVVFAGAPNVGKSSLVNALAGYHRCVVSPTPGTTRDVLTTLIALDGWPIELIDTAGLGVAAGTLENHGMELARAAAASADLCLWVVDASASAVWPEFRKDSMRVLINKVDLATAWDVEAATDAVRVSALTGMGLDKLCRLLSQWLVPEAPPPGAGVPFEAGLCAAIDEAWRLYRMGKTTASRAFLETACRTNNGGRSVNELLGRER